MFHLSKLPLKALLHVDIQLIFVKSKDFTSTSTTEAEAQIGMSFVTSQNAKFLFWIGNVRRLPTKVFVTVGDYGGSNHFGHFKDTLFGKIGTTHCIT